MCIRDSREVAHRVDGLHGGPGRDHDAAAGQVAAHIQLLEHGGHDVGRLGQAAPSHVAAGQIPVAGLDDACAADVQLRCV